MNSEWLTHIRATAISGQIETEDGCDGTILIEWKRAGILSPDLADFKKNVYKLASEETASTELQFLRANPEAALHELFLRACAPLLENGVETADWKAIEETIQETIKQFYLADLSKFGSAMIEPLMSDIYFFATVKNKEEDQLLGFVLFAITPALPFGNIKVINLCVRSTEGHRKLEKVLMCFILKLISKAKRIFLFIRPTSETALQMYHSLGFTRDQSPFQDPNHKINARYLISLEYRTKAET